MADTTENIGLVYAKTGKKSEAKTLFTEAAKISRNKLGPDHPLPKKSERLASVALSYFNMGLFIVV